MSLYGLMQEGAGVLLDASGERGVGGEASRLVAACFGNGPSRIRCVAVDAGPSMLVRPDACLAWAGEAGSTDGLAQALRRWFNPALEDGPAAR